MRIKLEKIDSYFLIILILGSILRLIFVLTIPLNVDSYPFIRAAMGILELDYNKYGTFRPPGFPLLIVPFLILTGNGSAAAKLASFTSSILLIICCFYVFRNASMRFFSESEKKREKATYIGFLVSFLISMNIYFIVHPGYGIREEYLTLLGILVFYFTVIKEESTFKYNIFLGLSISLLTLTLLTTGLFFTVGIILFVLISRLKWFKFKPMPIKKVLIIVIAFFISFISWAVFSHYTWGDAFYNWQVQSIFYENFYKMTLDSIDNIIQALFNALTGGIPYEFYYLFFFISFFFIIIVFYIIIKNIRIKQVLFIFLVIGLNLLYLSVFIAPSKLINIPNSSRVMVYLLPFFLYLGAIPLGNILVELKYSKEKYSKYIISLFIIFLVTYTLKGFPFIFKLGFGGFPFPTHPLFIIFLCINEISIFIFLIKTKNIKYSLN